MWSRAPARRPGRAGEGVYGRAGGGVEGAGPRRRWGQPASAPRRARTARGEGAAEIEGGRTSVSCPLMESICSWRPAMVAIKLAESDILLAFGGLRVAVTNDGRAKWRVR